MRFTKHISIACALLAVLAVATPAASASPSQIDFFEAPQQLLSSGGRSPAFQQLTGLGVRAIRIQLIWDEVAPKPNSRTKPNVNLANPASYNWGQYLYAIQQAQLLNWTVLLTVTGAAPCWASACATTPTKHETKRQKLDAIVTNPNATDYGKFLRAVGSKFGSYVKLYSIWNEPNQPQFLLPQYAAHHRLLSPSIYRRLFLAGYKGLRASGNFTRMKVLMGETSPVGGFSDISTPLAFMRGVLCLNSSYRKTSSCGRLPAAGYAQHPYDQRQGPYWVPPAYAGGKDDVTMATLGQLATALDRAAAAGAIRSHLPIYITEYGVQSYPNHGLGVPALQQAEYDAIAEQMAYNDPRVASFVQYLLTDDPIAPEASSNVVLV